MRNLKNGCFRTFCETVKLGSININWVSPLEEDNYAEYRNGDFLARLGLHQNLNGKLRDFWPIGGPQWDALGMIKEQGSYFMVEAKANIPEIITSIQAKSKKSISQIEKSLFERIGGQNWGSRLTLVEKYQRSNVDLTPNF